MEKEVMLLNETGLHARPATLFCKEAGKYKCNIKVEKDGSLVNAKSIMGILTLGASKGTTIKIITSGEDEETALTSLVSMIESKFGED